MRSLPACRSRPPGTGARRRFSSTASDCPPVFNVWLWEKGENVRDIVHRSKAVGEPPLMGALSVFHAIYDAVGATASSRDPVPLEAPATPENILKAIHELHRSSGR